MSESHTRLAWEVVCDVLQQSPSLVYLGYCRVCGRGIVRGPESDQLPDPKWGQ